MAQGRHILLVSDDTTIEHLRSALTRAASSHTLALVRTKHDIEKAPMPALILLDLVSQSDSPFELLRWLRSDERYQKTPVFALASSNVKERIDEAYALGANSCILRESESAGFDHIAHGIATYVSLRPSTPVAL